jgi:predicted oxidoreductase
MQALTLPTTSLPVSRIACGCMGLGGAWNDVPLAEDVVGRAERLVRAAVDAGITLFDHADIYARGKSEEAFGRILAGTPSLRDRIVLQSKCGIRLADDPAPGAPGRYDLSRRHIVASVEGSLRRLRTDRLDLLLLHRPDPLVEPEEVAAAFAALRASGKVRHFGVSNHTAAQMALLQAHVDQRLVVNQLQLSLWHLALIDDGVVANRADAPHAGAAGTLDECRRHGVLVQAYSPLGKGRHLGEHAPAEARAQALRQALDRLALEQGVSREAIAVAWLLRHPAGIQPIVGTTRPERLRACCEADRVVFPREAWYQLFVAARGSPVP